MPYMINAAVAASTAYLVSAQMTKGKAVVWYNPTTWM